MNTEISFFYRHLWQPVCRYLAEVQWRSSHADANIQGNGRSLLLKWLGIGHMGSRLLPVAAATESDVTWSEKGQIFRSMTKKVDKICGFSRGSVHLGTFLKNIRPLVVSDPQ